MASSSRRLVAEPVVSATVEGGPGSSIIIEPLRTDERLPEPASGDLAGTDASPVTVGVSITEPVTISTRIKGAPKDIADETIKSGAMTIVAPSRFCNAIVACKQPSLFAYL